MKDAYYFSHDANARNDEKVLMLRAEHGWTGYGIYWALIEMMFESSDTSLSLSKIKGIAVSYNIDITLLQDVINTCITEGLFCKDDDTFWSESLRRRKGKYHESKLKRSEAGKKGMAKRWGTDNTVITEDNTVITKDNKGKERKEKERKVNEIKLKESKEVIEKESPPPKKRKYGEFEKVSLLDDEYLKLLEKIGQAMTDDLIIKLDNYKASTGKTYKSDYATILNWSKREPIPNNQQKAKPSSNPFLEMMKDELEKQGGNPYGTY